MTELQNSHRETATSAPISRKTYTYTCRNIPWTDERIARLKELCQRGELSAAQIANQLGVTRNSVIGKASRLKLLLRAPPQKHAPPIEKRERRLRVASTAKPIIEPPPAMPFLAIPFARLTDNTCHYPRGDDPILFCGQPTGGAIYCAHCHRLTVVGGALPKGETPIRAWKHWNRGKHVR